MVELEKYKYEVDLKLKDHHNIEQQKTDLERHVQSLIKVSLVKSCLTGFHVHVHTNTYSECKAVTTF